MPSLNRHKLCKFTKIIASIVAIVVCGFFLAVFCVTYTFLSSIGKNESAKTTQSNSGSPVIVKPELPVRFSGKNTDQGFSPKQELASNDRLKQDLLFIKEIIKLRKDPRLEAAPPICEIICNPSSWQKRAEGEDLWDQFNSFLEKEGSRAFDDPKFRLAFELANSLADVMMISGEALETFEPILNRTDKLSEAEKIYWSAQAPIIIARVATKTKELIPKGRKQTKRVEKMIELNNQCDKRALSEIKESCLDLSEHF